MPIGKHISPSVWSAPIDVAEPELVLKWLVVLYSLSHSLAVTMGALAQHSKGDIPRLDIGKPTSIYGNGLGADASPRVIQGKAY